jgi:hypothetical protein
MLYDAGLAKTLETGATDLDECTILNTGRACFFACSALEA